MHVHLLVPDLLVPELAAPALPSAPALPPLDALETLLARGRKTRTPAATAESWLAGRYKLLDQSATAPFSLLGDSGEPENACWLRADPVHLRADRDALVLADASVFSLTADEATTLADSVNRHFAPALQFEPATPERWYARLDTPSALRWTPLAVVRGQPVTAHLPQGDGAMRWNALVNEMQMLLHAHPVNAEREARGELPVNSLWLWGEGHLATLATPATRPYGRTFADDPLARGLAMASGGSASTLPADAAALLAGAPDSGQALVMLDALRVPTAYGDADGRTSQLARMESGWFAPLLAALRAGRIGMLTLSCLGAAGRSGMETEVTRGDLRRFWRRRRPLAHHAALAEQGSSSD